MTDVIVCIPHHKGEILWEVDWLIRQQTFQDFQLEIVSNERMGLPAGKVPTWGHKAVVWIMREYHPKMLLFQPADTLVYENTLYQRFVDALKDQNCIGAGIRPRSKQGGNWHLACAGETVMWSGFLSIYNMQILEEYVENYLKIQTNTDTLHEACAGAIEDVPSYYFKPISSLVTYTNQH